MNSYWGKMEIGGHVPKHLVKELIKRLEVAFGKLDDDDNYNVDTLFEEGAIFCAESPDATEGHFLYLERWLRENDISYDVYEGSDGVYDPGLRRFRTGMIEEACYRTDHETYETFRWSEIEEAARQAGGAAVEALKLNAELEELPEGLVHTMRNALGLGLIQDLEPLTFTE